MVQLPAIGTQYQAPATFAASLSHLQIHDASSFLPCQPYLLPAVGLPHGTSCWRQLVEEGTQAELLDFVLQALHAVVVNKEYGRRRAELHAHCAVQPTA